MVDIRFTNVDILEPIHMTTMSSFVHRRSAVDKLLFSHFLDFFLSVWENSDQIGGETPELFLIAALLTTSGRPTLQFQH